MSQQSSAKTAPQNHNRHFLTGLARAFAGAIFFSLPSLMTMEMWWLGSYMDHFRLGLFTLLAVPLLILLSYFVGFEETFSLKEDAVDAFVAYAVGFITAAALFLVMNILEASMPVHEMVGIISLAAIPGAIGALLSQTQLGRDSEAKEREREASYWGELFLMLVGALFLAFQLAPTEEMILIAYKMSSGQALGLMVVSIIIMHAFVYVVQFRGQETPTTSMWNAFLRFTVVGYAIVLIASVYMLWTFGRTDGLSLDLTLMSAIVLGFPGAIGAAAARLIL